MKKNQTIFTIFFITYILSLSMLTSAQWTQKTNFPGNGRMAAVCFQIKKKAYMGTGLNLSTYTLYRDFWEFDPSTNTWTQKANFGGAGRFSAAEFVINDTGYVGLGSAGYPSYVWVTDFWMYDPLSNTWTQKNNFPGPGRYDAARFSINGKGYVGTGWAGALYNDFYEYDPSSDTWTSKTNFPSTTRQSTAYFAYGGKGYIGFGANGGTFYNDLYLYDPSTNTWTKKANCPGQVRNNTAQFTYGNYVYVGLGFSYSAGYMSDFWRYDPPNDSWVQADSFPGEARFHACTFVFDCKAYLTTGYTESGISENDFWELNLCSTPPTSSFQTSDSALCEYSCVNFKDMSTNATSWKWLFPGAQPSSSTDQNPQNICYFGSGGYDVTLIASNSGGSDTLSISNYINVYPQPPTPVIVKSGDTLFCRIDSSYISYQWYVNGTIIPGATDTFYISSANHFNYNVAVANKHNCLISVGILLGMDDKSANAGVTLFPNPVNDELVISLPKSLQTVDIEVRDILGKKLFQACNIKTDSAKEDRITLDFSNFTQGVYYITIVSEKERITRKVMKTLSPE